MMLPKIINTVYDNSDDDDDNNNNNNNNNKIDYPITHHCIFLINILLYYLFPQ